MPNTHSEDGLTEFFECGPMKQLKSMRGAKFSQGFNRIFPMSPLSLFVLF